MLYRCATNATLGFSIRKIIRSSILGVGWCYDFFLDLILLVADDLKNSGHSHNKIVITDLLYKILKVILISDFYSENVFLNPLKKSDCVFYRLDQISLGCKILEPDETFFLQ